MYKRQVLKSIALEKDSIVNCDETWCKVPKYDHYKKCYSCVLVNKARKTATIFYEYGSRGRVVLTDFLGDAEVKSIMSDGYNAYVFIGNELKLGLSLIHIFQDLATLWGLDKNKAAKLTGNVPFEEATLLKPVSYTHLDVYKRQAQTNQVYHD